jgi:hypothetical protein
MEQKIYTKVRDMNLRQLADGYIRFGIQAKDTEENQKIHESFKEFCKIETDNNYTQGIRKLLEYYQNDFKYELLFEKLSNQEVLLANLQASISELKSPAPKKEEKEIEMF